MPETRIKKYSDALSEAIVQCMESEPRLFVMGEGVDDPKGAFGTTVEAHRRYEARVLDTPLSENAMTGVGIGAALSGYPCIMVHLRTEFLLLAMSQLVDHAAKWHYMFGGFCPVPITIRCIVGRGWGQAAQHSQSFHGMFAQVPGLKVIVPAMPYDAKGMLVSAVRDPNPVICIEHRWLYDKQGEVPERLYCVPLGEARVVSPGKDVTCVALSYQVYEALAAKASLEKMGIEMEVIDLRSVRPMDTKTIVESVRKTGRLIVTDISPGFCGVSAEINASVCEQALGYLKAPPLRIALPEAPTPCASSLEAAYYPSVDDLVSAATKLVQGEHTRPSDHSRSDERPQFMGPF